MVPLITCRIAITRSTATDETRFTVMSLGITSQCLVSCEMSSTPPTEPFMGIKPILPSEIGIAGPPASSGKRSSPPIIPS